MPPHAKPKGTSNDQVELRREETRQEPKPSKNLGRTLPRGSAGPSTRVRKSPLQNRKKTIGSPRPRPAQPKGEKGDIDEINGKLNALHTSFKCSLTFSQLQTCLRSPFGKKSRTSVLLSFKSTNGPQLRLVASVTYTQGFTVLRERWHSRSHGLISRTTRRETSK